MTLKHQHQKLVVLGSMTGSSCDGSDIAIVEYTINPKKVATKGFVVDETIRGFSQVAFSKALKQRLQTAQKGLIALKEFGRLEVDYSIFLAEHLNNVISDYKLKRRDLLIGIHGQTLWHEPESHFSIQAINTSIVTTQTGCTTVYNFRAKDLAHAGEGAPLAPNYLRLFCDHQKINGVAFHNIGGIANTAVLDKKKNIYLGFDTGPGNLLIDMAVKQFTRGKQSYDHNGQMALAGWSSINEKRLIQLLKNPFFNTPPPKSTGKEVFSEDYLNEFRSSGLQLIAETTCFTAITMALAYRKFVLPKTKLRKIYITGGGAHNHTLMRAFAQYVNVKAPFIDVAPLGILGDSLEATAFARFALEGFAHRLISDKVFTGAHTNSFGASITTGDNYLELVTKVFK